VCFRFRGKTRPARLQKGCRIRAKPTLATDPNQEPGQQPVDISRIRRDIEPKVPSVRAGIYGRFLNGASLKSLADSTGCEQAFIVAVIRDQARVERDNLRLEIQQQRKRAA
jgi:hypothetical protein